MMRGPWRAQSEERLELGEGARWVGEQGVLVDLLAGRLLRVSPDGGELQPLLEVAMPLGAVSPRAGGGWIAAAGTGIALLGDDGSVTWVATPAASGGTPLRMNDGVSDPQGRFWAGSMAYDGTPGAGSLYRVDTDLSVTEVVRGLTVPNGPAFDEDGGFLYLADSPLGVVTKYAVDFRSGSLSGAETFIQVDDASPDGMTVDAGGCLWVAMWGGSRVDRYAPDGDLLESLAVPARQPTSIAVSPGPEPEILVTTAAYGLDPQDLDGRVLRASVDVEGLPTRIFGG